ncbi:MAG: FMN-binding protein [Aristaeellaceae bacterium]
MENQSKRKQLPAFLVLAIIALVAGVVLAVTNMVTKGPIAEHQMAALKASFGAVMPADEYKELTVSAEDGVSSLYEASTDGKTIGWCVTASAKGYAGDVAVTLGVGTDGLVTGCVVGDLNFAETANFGARAKEPAFQDQFKGIDAINGGAFQALSGATITSNAVKDATNAALSCVARLGLGKTPVADPIVVFGESKPAPAADVTTEADGSLRTTAEGFGGAVVIVKVLVEDGKVSKLVIDASTQTEYIGTRVMEEPEFAEQFIGQTGPFTAGENIDVLSGATITSKAVIEAVNNALGFTADAPVAAPVTTEADGSLRTTAEGFGGAVVIVKVLVEDGKVSKLVIDASTQTEYIGTRVMEEPEFAEQFIGQTGPFTAGENIDVLSGATITSKAVIEAVNNALGFTADAPVAAPVTTEADGSLRTTAEGFGGAVVIVKVLVEDGKVSKLVIDASTQTEYIGTRVMEEPEFAEQFIGQTGPFTAGENIDVLSGATVTSDAVIEAVNHALGY